MREFRTSYNAPRYPDRVSEHGNISTRVDVGVGRVTTRTGEAMLHPSSNYPACRTRLARVGGVDEDRSNTGGLRFVDDEILQLPECPSMQACTHPLSGLDTIPDVRQVFHADFASTDAHGLCDYGFAGLVIDVLYMPLLAPGDSLEFAPGGTTTIGLETTAMGKVNVPFVAHVASTPDLASTGSGEIVFPDIDAHSATRRRLDVRKIENEIEVPNTFAYDEFCFFWCSACKQVALMLPTNERNLDASGQCEQRQHVTLDRVGTFIEVDGCSAESDYRNGLIFGNVFIGLERFVGIGDAVNGLAHHLTTEIGKPLADGVVAQVMQCDSVPTAMLLGKRDDGIASLGINIGQRSKRLGLLGDCDKLERDRPFHIGHYTPTKIALQTKGEAGTGAACAAALSLPGMNAGVSRAER